MNVLKPVMGNELKYDRIIGTGGIGAGIFFKLHGDHTLGRNESRQAELVPYKDYCKLHIIMHYISVMLGAQSDGSFRSYPIGKIGADEPGKQLLQAMKDIGMNMTGVETVSGENTLFSVCFQYPDSTGGNITSANSACRKVTAKDIECFFNNLKPDGRKEMILAVPEVPLAPRLKLLEIGRNRSSFNIVSVLPAEIDEFKNGDGFMLTDLLSINIDEAGKIAGLESAPSDTVINACLNVLTGINSKMMVFITDGPNGSYGYSNGRLEFIPPLKTKAIGTGGAGDAFLSGIITGVCCGLPALKNYSDHYFSETPLASAGELGTLLASFSVTSPDTIHPSANAQTLYDYALHNSVCFSADFARLFNHI
jgi:sugar/nucleoside kinase (ribokinase family)